MVLATEIPFDQLSTDEQAIWHVFEPIQAWKARDVRYEFVFDTVNHQFQVIRSGWRGSQRLYAVLIHVAIRGEFVWVEEDNTELEVANLLVEYGIPKERIVLGFHPPQQRTLEGFALGE